MVWRSNANLTLPDVVRGGGRNGLRLERLRLPAVGIRCGFLQRLTDKLAIGDPSYLLP